MFLVAAVAYLTPVGIYPALVDMNDSNHTCFDPPPKAKEVESTRSRKGTVREHKRNFSCIWQFSIVFRRCGLPGTVPSVHIDLPRKSHDADRSH